MRLLGQKDGRPSLLTPGVLGAYGSGWAKATGWCRSLHCPVGDLGVSEEGPTSDCFRKKPKEDLVGGGHPVGGGRLVVRTPAYSEADAVSCERPPGWRRTLGRANHLTPRSLWV